jgi:hypothetical protein
MWIFLSEAFFSIVAHPTKKNILVVRARINGDIERVFGKVDVIVTPGRDYMYRAFIERGFVSRLIAEEVYDISATNFKDSVKDNDRHGAYFQVWTAMEKLQTRLHWKKNINQREFFR